MPDSGRSRHVVVAHGERATVSKLDIRTGCDVAPRHRWTKRAMSRLFTLQLFSSAGLLRAIGKSSSEVGRMFASSADVVARSASRPDMAAYLGFGPRHPR